MTNGEAKTIDHFISMRSDEMGTEDAAGAFFDKRFESVNRLGNAAGRIAVRHLLALDAEFQSRRAGFSRAQTYGSNRRKHEGDTWHAPIVSPAAIAFEKICGDHLAVMA